MNITEAAIHFIAGRHSEPEAIEAARLRDGRQRLIRREASRLMQLHFGRVYADILKASPHERIRMAKLIADAEGIGLH